MISGAKILLAKEWLTGNEAIHLLSVLIKDSVSVKDFIDFTRKHHIPAHAMTAQIALLDIDLYSDRKTYVQHIESPVFTLEQLQKGKHTQSSDTATATATAQADCAHSDIEYPHEAMLKGHSYRLIFSDKYCEGNIYFHLLGAAILVVEGKNKAGELTRWEVNTGSLSTAYQLLAHFLPNDMRKLASIINNGTLSGHLQPVTVRSGWHIKPPNRIDDLAESILRLLYQAHQKSPDNPPLISELIAELISSDVLSVKNNNRSQLYLNDSSKEPITQSAMKARIKRYIGQ